VKFHHQQEIRPLFNAAAQYGIVQGIALPFIGN
jgi:hypothetical protein